MSKPEQIGDSRRWIHGAWHAIKKFTARLRRRQVRQDIKLEREPSNGKDYKGWHA